MDSGVEGKVISLLELTQSFVRPFQKRVMGKHRRWTNAVTHLVGPSLKVRSITPPQSSTSDALGIRKESKWNASGSPPPKHTAVEAKTVPAITAGTLPLSAAHVFTVPTAVPLKNISRSLCRLPLSFATEVRAKAAASVARRWMSILGPSGFGGKCLPICKRRALILALIFKQPRRRASSGTDAPRTFDTSRLRHPQDRVWPLRKFEESAVTELPHSHRHLQIDSRRRSVPSNFKAVNLPNVCPARSMPLNLDTLTGFSLFLNSRHRGQSPSIQTPGSGSIRAQSKQPCRRADATRPPSKFMC